MWSSSAVGSSARRGGRSRIAGGLRVTVLDQGAGAPRAASGNFGLVWVQSKGATFRPYASLSPFRGALARVRRRAAATLRASTVGLRRGRSLTLSFGRRSLPPEASSCAISSDARSPGTRRAERDAGPQSGARKCCRRPANESSGAWYCRSTRASIHCACPRFAAGIPAPGQAATCPGARSPGSFETARLQRHRRAERVAGAKLRVAAGLGRMRPSGPLRRRAADPRRSAGQMLITDQQPQWLDVTTTPCRQMPDGGLLISDSQEDGATIPARRWASSATSRRAVRSFPRLGSATCCARACLRVMTPDGFPVYEQSKPIRAHLHLPVHSGVTLAALHARELAEAVSAGGLAEPLAPFFGDRFAIPKPDRHAPESRIRFRFNGIEVDAVAGQTIAAALLAAGQLEFRRSTRTEANARPLVPDGRRVFECVVEVRGRRKVPGLHDRVCAMAWT